MDAKQIVPDEDRFDEYLNGEYGYIEVSWQKFWAADIFKELNNRQYERELQEWQKENTTYECGECGDAFDNEDSAEECCQEEEDDGA